MTIREAIHSSGINPTDASVLLAALLHKDRTWIFAHEDDAFPLQHEAQWREWTKRRVQHEPVAYITGVKEFFGHTFTVNESVLIPRPATERVVEIALDILTSDTPVQLIEEIDEEIVAWADVWGRGVDATCIADIGTGSGCIAVSIAIEKPALHVIATDISSDALILAKQNAATLGARIELRQGDVLHPLADLNEPFLLISNPPYIPNNIQLEADVMHFEPHQALFSGEDGADLLRKIVSQAKAHPHCIGFLIECRKEQAA